MIWHNIYKLLHIVLGAHSQINSLFRLLLNTNIVLFCFESVICTSHLFVEELFCNHVEWKLKRNIGHNQMCLNIWQKLSSASLAWFEIFLPTFATFCQIGWHRTKEQGQVSYSQRGFSNNSNLNMHTDVRAMQESLYQLLRFQKNDFIKKQTLYNVSLMTT